MSGLAAGEANPGAALGWGGSISGAFLAAAARPRWWAIALATFLLRGGIVAVIVPIMTLPTIATLSSLASPTIAAIAFGNPSPGLVATYALLGGGLATWVVVALVVGTWLDMELVRDTARDEELGSVVPTQAVSIRRALTVRLIAHVGTLVAATYALVRLVVEGYGEIFSPGDPAVPLAWRIALRTPDAIAVLVGAWLAGEGVGGLATRWLAVGASPGAALGRGLRQLARPSGLATLIVTSVGVVVALLPLWLAGSRAWDLARAVLVDEAPTSLLVMALLLLVTSWGLGLALLAAGLAWRSAAWTAEAYRATASSRGSASRDER